MKTNQIHTLFANVVPNTYKIEHGGSSTNNSVADSFTKPSLGKPSIGKIPLSHPSIIASFLGAQPQTIRMLNGGDNDVYLVDGTWIFRFPKSNSARCANIREQALLAMLRPHVATNSIPHYTYWDESTGVGGYRIIDGVNLSRSVVKRLSPEDVATLAKDSAQILAQLHSCNTNSSALACADVFDKERERLHHLPQLMEEVPLFSAQEITTINIACARVEKLLEQGGPSTILHGDLHCDNIIFNEQTRKLSGLIDFSDAVVGPPHFDLIGFYRASPALAKEVQRHYAQLMQLDEASFTEDCRALALVKYARDVLINKYATTTQSIRRLARSGFVVTSLLE